MGRLIELLVILAVVIAAIVVVWKFTGRRLEQRRNDPYKGMSRNDRSAVIREEREIELRKRKLELERQELQLQEEQQRFYSTPLPRFNDPITGNTDKKKDTL